MKTKKKLILLIEELLSYSIKINKQMSSSMTMLQLNYWKLIDSKYPVCRFKLPNEFDGFKVTPRSMELVSLIKQETEKLKELTCKKCNAKYKEEVMTIIPPIKCRKDN